MLLGPTRSTPAQYSSGVKVRPGRQTLGFINLGFKARRGWTQAHLGADTKTVPLELRKE